VYELSRALYRDLRPLLEVDSARPGRVERALLHSCEQVVEGIAGGLHYFPNPAAYMFGEVRFLFPVGAQQRVRAIIGGRLAQVQQRIAQSTGGSVMTPSGRRRCIALTAQGSPCRREAQLDSRFCSSHRAVAARARGARAVRPAPVQPVR
jgi:hypothetical protein